MNLISTNELLEILNHQDASLNPEQVKEEVNALSSIQIIPCGHCPSYIHMEDVKGLARCKRLGFWFEENFSCGYCESADRKIKIQF